jgi:hypothetical protein
MEISNYTNDKIRENGELRLVWPATSLSEHQCGTVLNTDQSDTCICLVGLNVQYLRERNKKTTIRQKYLYGGHCHTPDQNFMFC